MSRLIDAIKEYQEGTFKKKAPVEIQETMLAATKKLQEEGISKYAPKVGDKFKDVQLLDIEAKEVKLYDYFKDNDFLVINFYRGAWCPYCNLELKALQSVLGELGDLGASLIAISPQTPDNSLTTKEKNDLEFEVLSDIGNKVAKEIGLVFSLADELRPIYEKFGIDIPASNDDDSFNLPMPATFILNKDAEIIFSFVDEDYTKRTEPQDIIDTIKNAK